MSGAQVPTPDGTRWHLVDPPDFGNTDCQHDDLRHLFFAPDKKWGSANGRGQRNREHEARRVCAECPFIVECALHGLEHEEFGVWGALAEDDRRGLGGQGHGSPGPALPIHAVKRMSAAGVPEHTAKTILRRWKQRKRELDQEVA